jgi:hypothetical protein
MTQIAWSPWQRRRAQLATSPNRGDWPPDAVLVARYRTIQAASTS